MARPDFYERIVPISGSEVRVVSSVDIRTLELGRAESVLSLHGGLGKDPVKHLGLMALAKTEDFIPLAFDTRRSKPHDTGIPRTTRSRKEQLAMRRAHHGGVSNATSEIPMGYFALRRTLALEQALSALGITASDFVGFSDGARIGTLAALRNPILFKQLALVNAAGLGNSWHAYKRLFHSNIAEITAMLNREVPAIPFMTGGTASASYAASAPLRIIREKRILQATNLWSAIDRLETEEMSLTVLAAKEDPLVQYEDVQTGASQRDWVDFIETEGRHTNMYTPEVERIVIQALVENRTHRSRATESA